MKTKIVPIQDLLDTDISQMFELMCQYYEGVSLDVFKRDLLQKQKVILLLSPTQILKGFSTILETSLQVDGKAFIALFSGDTVLDREYWGNGALGLTFVRHLLTMKLRHLSTPIYWFLICKGYRTYLLMANNFATHFPRYEQTTPPRYKAVMDCFYENRFKDHYNPAKGLVCFSAEESSHLKPYVAEITKELANNPRISFFEKMNPEWAQGVELACVAKVTVWIPFRYAFKRIKKYFRRRDKSFAAAYTKQ